MSADELLQRGNDFLKRHGLATVLVFALMAVLFGWVPSKLVTLLEGNHDLLIETQGIVKEHADTQARSSSKLINLSLTDCVNQALLDQNAVGARVCLESVDDTEYIQKRRLEKLITRQERNGGPP